MREILFKNLTAEDYKKRDILITEVVEESGVITKVERRCKYFVTNVLYFDKAIAYEELTNSQIAGLPAKRDYFILRKKDVDSGEDVLICKVLGTLYAVVDHYVFSVVYLHTIKIKLSTLSAKNKLE